MPYDPSITLLRLILAVIIVGVILFAVSMLSGCHLVDSIIAGVRDGLQSPPDDGPDTGAPTESKIVYFGTRVAILAVAVFLGWGVRKRKKR